MSARYNRGSLEQTRRAARLRLEKRLRTATGDAAFTGVLANNDIAISIDGKGAWRDNVFVERLWRSVKYEEVYSIGFLKT